MSNNDPRRNMNNLLFRPNNAINDDQPAFFFYSQPEPPRSTTTTLASISGINIPENTAGLNNNHPYQFINQTNTWSETAPDTTLPIRQVPIEPLPPVILFSNTGPSKTTPEAFTISTYSTGTGVATSESKSVPLFSASLLNNSAQSVPLFPPPNTVQAAPPFQASIPHPIPTKPVVTEPEQIVPLFPASVTPIQPTSSDSGSSIPLFTSLGSTSSSAVETEPAQTVPFYAEVPPAQPPPAIPLYSPGDLPPKSGINQSPPTGSTNTYRRIGSKRPVYAPIPGLQPQQQQHSSLADYFSPQPTLKHTNQIDPAQSNSPFLSPVTEPPILPSEDFNCAHIPNPSLPIMAVNDGQIPNAGNMFSSDNRLPLVSTSVSTTYTPPHYHWFYKKELDNRVTWEPFSMNDSANLENNFTSPNLTPENNIPTEGGRFDVNILRRQKTSVYWDSKPAEVRRCSWFHKSHTESKHVPFEENIATKLEEEYKQAVESNKWARRVYLPSGDSVMFHTPDVLVLNYSTQVSPAIDSMDTQPKQKVVKRGIQDQAIDEGESEEIDHLLFMVHGIGAGCDLKFRSVEEVVHDFRNIALQLVRTHYRSSCNSKLVHRVEVLPVSWHNKLHSEDTGIDNKLKSITLDSIPKLREFTNDTLLDILFYTSPFYGQTIISSVGNELNKIFELFKQRNPDFKGGISLAGHSLGSLILFDILCNQIATIPNEAESIPDKDEAPLKDAKPHPLNRKMSRRISYVVGNRGTGQPQINYPILNFQPSMFFALGSPIGMFVTIRGLDNLGEEFALPTCPGFYNIFHPYDPVAYRIESLVNSQLAKIKPVLIPHHKGRKRMHLELKETMAKVGSDLKQKLVDSMKNTWNSLLGWSNTRPSMQPTIAEEVDKVLEQFASKHSGQCETEDQACSDVAGINLGALNKGRRVDYVLQEAPVEFFNEYIFALSSHVCYWDSEDTVLMIVKEIYNLLNVAPDSQIPQQTMTIERPVASRTPEAAANHEMRIGVDPTMPIRRDTNVAPPPLSGFVKNS